MQLPSATDDLIKALSDKDLRGVKQALADGGDPNKQSRDSHSPIWYEFAIDLGRDANEPDPALCSQIFDLIIPKARNVTQPNFWQLYT